MAIGANFYIQVAAVCGACLERISTTACDRDFTVIWMYFRFHNGLSEFDWS